MDDYIYNHIKIFPGSKEEFEEFVGFPVKVVDLGRPDAGIIIAERRGERTHDGFKGRGIYGWMEYATPDRLLREHEIVGMINATLSQSDWSSSINSYDGGTERIWYGLPVARS